MGEINLSRDEQDAINAIDRGELDKLVDDAIRFERWGDLNSLPLERCGPYVSSNLARFREALLAHGKAKAAKKRAETSDALYRASLDLRHAFSAMQRRLEEEQRDGQFFYVDDHIMQPYHFSESLDVRVSYRWRRAVEDPWTSGSITFLHKAVRRTDYNRFTPKRKPSKAQQERDRQDWLYQTWDHLRKSALYTLRDYFKDGGDGSKIPETFQTIPDEHFGSLNNHSTKFWREQPGSR